MHKEILSPIKITSFTKQFIQEKRCREDFQKPGGSTAKIIAVMRMIKFRYDSGQN